MNKLTKDRTGVRGRNTFGSEMVVVKYRNCDDIDVLFPQYNRIFNNATYYNFKKGSISCPYEPRIHNIGYIGEGKYKNYANKNSKYFAVWSQMLLRCYSDKYKKKHPTYQLCKTSEEWFNFQNFAKWFDENYYEVKDQTMNLDKDILVKGNKIYSPETCIFVPQEINNLFIKCDKNRNNLPIGVRWHRRDKIYETSLNKGKTSCYLGRYNTPEEAFLAYKKAKEEYIKEVADKYKDQIPQKLYDAMYKYEVEITN